MKVSNKSIRVLAIIALVAFVGSALASPPRRPSTPIVSPSRPDNASNRQIRTSSTRYSYHKRKATESEKAVVVQRAVVVQKQVKTKSKSAPKRRYVAVPTKKPDTVMLYDTKKEKVIGSSAYDMKKTPKKGEVVKFGFISAEYVGI